MEAIQRALSGCAGKRLLSSMRVLKIACGGNIAQLPNNVVLPGAETMVLPVGTLPAPAAVLPPPPPPPQAASPTAIAPSQTRPPAAALVLVFMPSSCSTVRTAHLA